MMLELDSSPASRLVTRGQRKSALLVSVFIVLVTALLLPVADTVLARIPAFIPAYQTSIILFHGVAAYLVFSHFLGTGCVALLYLGCGCLYTTVILIAQFLSFPGMFGPESLLPGGTQTTIWLWVMWHIGPAVGMLLYAWCEWRDAGRVVAAPRPLMAGAVVVVMAGLGGSLAAVTVFQGYLPVLDVGGDFRAINSSGVAPVIELVTAVALLLLWWRGGFRTVLQVWVAVALVALLCDNAVTMAGGTRLSVGWYAGRIGALISAGVLFIGYLREINRVYLLTVARARELQVRVEQGEVQLDEARLDALTRLPARALFLDRATGLQHRSIAQGESFAVLYVDLDGFKRVNDVHGHDRGDAVLIKAAEVLRSLLRGGDVAGRLGGDEFAVCIGAPHDAIERVATSVASRLVAGIGRIGDGIGCSVGISVSRPDCPDLACALKRADEAMYEAKRSGKNRYALYGAGDCRVVSCLAVLAAI